MFFVRNVLLRVKHQKRFDGEFVDYAILSSTISEEYKKNYVAEHHPTMGGNKNIGLTIVGISVNLSPMSVGKKL